MSFPKPFLKQIAGEKELSQEQIDVFLLLFGDDMSRAKIDEALNISETARKKRLTEIYSKFNLKTVRGRKEIRLREDLERRYRRWQTTNSVASEDTEPDIDARVQEVRNAIKSYIQEKCGTMRVLDMNQPIGLSEIYTHVNILERITGRIGRELADLNGKSGCQQFDRVCLGNVREERVPGLDAVEKYAKLMVLGKPGAGKSTFLKHLAIQCMGGKFQATRVPIFVTLKDFADTPGKPDLLGYLDTYLKKRVSLAEAVRGERALLLLDGLDEVREADSSRVLRQIEEISQQFPDNQYVITCRIAAQEYRFESFTEVEIADFDDAQIADFSGKWFDNKNDLSRSLNASRLLSLDPEQKQILQTLNAQLPDMENDREELEAWWQANGEAWREQLRAAIIQYRNIGHDWPFNETQKELLDKYHEANDLIINCLKSDCYVSREVRQEIEETLLLPIAQIEQRRR